MRKCHTQTEKRRWRERRKGGSGMKEWTGQGTEDKDTVFVPIFFLGYSSSVSVLLTTNPMSLWQVLFVKGVLSYLLTSLLSRVTRQKIMLFHTLDWRLRDYECTWDGGAIVSLFDPLLGASLGVVSQVTHDLFAPAAPCKLCSMRTDK
jgi:hypothetical protein